MILSRAVIPTKYGDFELVAFPSKHCNYAPHLAYIAQPWDDSKIPNVRIHSECITGDLFGSKRCDCGPQFDESTRMVFEEGGLVLYLRQEGRGIGIVEKLKAYQIQDEGIDTFEANRILGHGEDERDFSIASNILKELGITKINLITNNPNKVDAVVTSGIEVVNRIPLLITPSKENIDYLRAKKEQHGHLLSVK